MAHTIEVRCPFLDRKVYAASIDCVLNDLIIHTDNGIRGKQILREVFRNDLPNEIIERNKMSFDVGSGIRKLVVEYLTRNGKNEKEKLKDIWINHFRNNLSNDSYFHSYPTFDSAIDKRGFIHR
jgi:asparagine synthase (glutamine-hydrolysing)